MGSGSFMVGRPTCTEGSNFKGPRSSPGWCRRGPMRIARYLAVVVLGALLTASGATRG